MDIADKLFRDFLQYAIFFLLINVFSKWWPFGRGILSAGFSRDIMDFILQITVYIGLSLLFTKFIADFVIKNIARGKPIKTQISFYLTIYFVLVMLTYFIYMLI
jgi:Kef-type K+ transport system membrane component KefB